MKKRPVNVNKDEVRLDIGGVREEDETCVDENIKDKTLI